MRVSIATDNGHVAQHFGRCPAFTIVEIEDGQVTSQTQVANPGHRTGFLPKFMHEQGVDVMVTGGMGQRAVGFFQQFGIQPVVGVQGPIDAVVQQLCEGTLTEGPSLCSPGGGKGYGIPKEDGHGL